MKLNITKELATLKRMTVQDLRVKFADTFGERTTANNKTWLIRRIAWRMQADAEGDLSERARQRARELANDADLRIIAPKTAPMALEPARIKILHLPSDDRLPPPGSIITRTYKGETLQVKVLENGFEFEGVEYKSLERRRQGDHRFALQRLLILPHRPAGGCPMKRNATTQAPQVRCAIYTRKSTEEGLQQEFNSLDAQREAAEAYIVSQKHDGWVCLPTRYDDGGFTGGNMDRPALRRLIADIETGKIDCVVVYKVDRLSRSLMDFARMMQTFDERKIAFVSVTQQFNTGTSMGRLVLNVLLSFAQFEREMVSERTRDKIAATRRKGKWTGGLPMLGYDVDRERNRLVVNADEARRVKAIFGLYLELESLLPVVRELNNRGWVNKRWQIKKSGTEKGGRPFDRVNLHRLLTNPIYIGKVRYKDELHAGEHAAIIDPETWQRTQALLARNGRSGGGSVRNKFGALLKGIVHCSACNCAMTPCAQHEGPNALQVLRLH